MIYVTLAFPDATANVNALKPDLEVVVRYGTTSYKYVKGGIVEVVTKVTDNPIT